jgi:O-antigen/teichoic acid export membrane protein
MARALLAFGLPLVLNFLSYWVLQLSDRELLSRIGPYTGTERLAQTASYAVAYSLGTVLSTAIVTPFTLAWPTAMYTIAKRHDASYLFRLVFRWFGLLLILAGFGLSLASSLVLKRLFPPSYQSAGPLVPIVAMSIVFYGIYFVFMTGANLRRKTWLAAVFTTVAALLNFGLNLWLIPLYGSVGAAASTAIAYVVLAAVAYAVNQRLYRVRFEIGMFVIALAGSVVLYLAGTTGTSGRPSLVAWAAQGTSLAACLAWLLLIGCLAWLRDRWRIERERR